MVWHPAVPALNLEQDTVLGLTVAGVPIALYRLGDAIYATHGICTHAHACLADGYYEDGKIECPLHQAVFDVRTGRALGGPAQGDLEIYPVSIQGGVVMVELGVAVTPLLGAAGDA